MFTVVNELFVTPEDRPEFERNFPASMRGTLPGGPGLRDPDHGSASLLGMAPARAIATGRVVAMLKDPDILVLIAEPTEASNYT